MTIQQSPEQIAHAAYLDSALTANDERFGGAVGAIGLRFANGGGIEVPLRVGHDRYLDIHRLVTLAASDVRAALFGAQRPADQLAGEFIPPLSGLGHDDVVLFRV